MLKHVGIIYLLIISLKILMANRCCQLMNKNTLKFKLIRRHSRSTEFILSERVLSSVKQCREFAILKSALAFNFFPLDTPTDTKTKINKDRHNCQVIGCPETTTADSLVHDDKFSYYSLYSHRNMPLNDSVKCLPKVGLFVTSRKYENYSNAQVECSKMNGKLAHIVSAERSIGLAKYIFGTPTFVGLSNRGRDRLWRNEFGESLSCFEYRAWATGEPSSRGCVALTTSFTSASPSILLPLWKVVTCSKLLPFICEILPSFNSL